MRRMILCLTAAAVGLALMEVVSAGPGDGPAIDRTHRGDPAGPRLPAPPEATIASVEIIGLETASVVFRDRDGRLLYRTEPLGNTTIIARGVQLPKVTLLETAREIPTRLTIDGAQERDPAVAPEEEAERPSNALPDGCEPAASPLSPLGSSESFARCVTQLDPTRLDPAPAAAREFAFLDIARTTR